MIELREIGLKNIIYFRDSVLKLKTGITVIRGLNKNSPNVDNNTNGVGKSLLISALPNVIYASVPLAPKKNDKKSLFIHKADSEISIKLKQRGHSFEVAQQSKGSSVKYNVIEAKKERKFATPTKCEDFIRNELFPLSEQLFYSTVFLTVQRVPIFQRGTDTQRLDFFTEIFELDSYDKIRMKLLHQLKELKAKNIQAQTRMEQLAEYEQELLGLKWDKDKEKRLTELQDSLNTYNEQYSSIGPTYSALKNHLVLAKQIEHFENLLSEFKSKSSSDVESEIELAERALRKAQRYNRYIEELATYTKSTTRLKSRLKEAKSELAKISKPDVSVKKLKVKLDKAEELEDKYVTQVERIEYLRDQYDLIDSKIGDVPRPKSSLKELQTRQFELNQLIKLSKQVKGDITKCPVCQSKFDTKDLQKNIKRYESSLNEVEEQIDLLKLYIELDKITDEAQQFKGYDKKLKILRSEIKELKAKIEDSKTYQDAKTKVEDLQESLSEIREPNEVTEPSSTDEDVLGKVVKRYEKVKTYLKEHKLLVKRQKEEFDEIRYAKDLESELSKLETKQAKLGSKILKINQVLPNLIVEHHKYNDLIASIEELRIKIKKYEQELEDIPILEALIKAYSSKGLKVEVAQQIALLVSSNLNRYSSLIFAESFKFNIKVAENTFEVLVDRGNGIVSDVRRLSGAESNCFNLLLLLSILPLIPNHKRVDTLFLDEMDAMFGDSIKKLFTERFLPMLQSIVPKVVVVSTAKNLNIPEAQNILVVKEGTTSRLEEL